MPNYLYQLAARIQQPELAMQPRPLSLFEPPSYSSLEWSHPGTLPESRVGSTAELQEPSKPLPPSSPDADQLIGRTERTSYNSAHRGKDRSRPEFERTELIPEFSSIGQRDQPPRDYMRDRPLVTSHVRRMEGDDRLASQFRENASPEKPAQDLFSQTDRAIRAAAGERVNEEQSVKPPVTAVQSVPPGRRTQPALVMQGVQGEEATAQPIPSMNQPVDPLFRDAGSSLVSVLRPHFKRREFRADQVVVPQHDAPQLDRLLEGKISGVPNVPPRSRLDLLTTRADRGEVQHATDRGTEPTTIQVSIGRIEVRATVVSVPAQKNQMRSSAMSLDEYLTRRNGGR